MTKQQLVGANGSVAELERAELAAIYELGQAINANLALDQTATAALQGILKAVSPDIAFLFLREGDRLVLQNMLPSSSPRSLGVFREHQVGQCICGLAVSEGKALYSRNINNDPRCAWDECKQAGLVSFAALPLRSRDAIIGVIGLASGTERDFEKQSRFLETLVSQISVAIANAQLHQALREDEEKYRITFENAPMGMVRIDPDRRFLAVNPAFCQMVGYAREELLGRTFNDITHPDDVEQGTRWVGQQVSGEVRQLEFEKRYVHKDGHVIWAVVRSRWVRDAAGAPRFSVAHVQDITERKRAEAVLRQSEEKLRIAFDNAPMGMNIVGADGQFVSVNPAFCQMVGYSREELLSGTLQNITHPDDIESGNRWMRRMISGDLSQPEFEKRYIHKDGRIVWAVVRARWVRNAHGSPPLSVVHVQDITEKRRAEDESRKLQEQLYQAQKMEAIGTLAGGIAHDFNNILAGIMGRLSLLELKLGEPGTQESDIQESKALVGRGADLAKQLLGFARGGKYDLRPLDLAHAVQKMSSMFGRTRTDITIQLDFAPGLLAVHMDRTQLEQVLMNLFLNASQAMPDGGRILVRAENMELGSESEEVKFHGAAPGRFIKLLVTDTGVGMDAATRARVFEPFFTTKDTGQGTGLGLASVYGIIKGHGGLISVRSQPREGTTFTLLLPATDRPAVGSTVPGALIQRGHGTILVVDDEGPILRTCARMLEQIGYDVLTASGGKQAIELLRQHGGRISLVMLDMTMPEMSGGETYDRLKEIAPAAKVLLCSGYSLEGQAQKILERGCNGFIQKPFDIATLSAKLLEIL